MRTAQRSIVWALILFSCILHACAEKEQKSAETKKLKVIATIFPLYDMAKAIGADKAEVSMLLPPGVEAHSFEPRPGDIVKINEADVFLYTGKFMEPWAEDIIHGIANKDLIIIQAGDNATMIQGLSGNAGGYDPHIWLDFGNAEIMVTNILKAFQQKDPDHRDFYAQNADEYRRNLADLDSTYRKTLGACRSSTIIYGGHYAFGYLAKRYGLKYLAAQGIAADAEPAAGDLVKLVEQIKKEKISYIFYEELTSTKIAETIARETNAKMLLLNAAHNLSREQVAQGVSFIDILRKNLDNLRTGLECR